MHDLRRDICVLHVTRIAKVGSFARVRVCACVIKETHMCVLHRMLGDALSLTRYTRRHTPRPARAHIPCMHVI